MKITNIETFLVPPRWLFVKIETSQGISGWGEPVIEGRARTVKAAVEELSPYLVGKDPRRIEDHWQVLYRGGFYRGGPILMSALAGLDQALWDIKGKALSVPVYQLLGGKCRDSIQVYSWIGGDKPQDVKQAARQKKKAGFKAVKMNATAAMHYIETPAQVETVANRVKAVREEVGSDFGLGIDFHGRVHKPMVKRLIKALEPVQPMFIEEPVVSENNEVLETIKSQTEIPIATGERMYSRWEFKELLAAGNVDIVQPDLSHAGGITECKKIASMAEAYDIAVAFHCPLGPIALAACLQVDATIHNAYIQEQSLGIHYNQEADLLDYLVNPEVFEYQAGQVKIPSKPGLGIEINEDQVRKQAKEGHDWKNPIWRQDDGSIAEW